MKVSVAERIIRLLEQSGSLLCDDCITTALGLGRRQHANAECNRLFVAGRIARERNKCSRCYQNKLVSVTQGREPSSAPLISPPKRVADSKQAAASLEGRPVLTLGEFHFRFVCYVEPDTDGSGDIAAVTPRMLGAEERGLTLHRHGHGPFCKFRVPSEIRAEGVYLVIAEDRILYVGRCDNFSDRFNMGYGQISPRNCYEGGQQTNCRINNLIFKTISQGMKVKLWFLPTSASMAVEAELIGTINPSWNSKRGRAIL